MLKDCFYKIRHVLPVRWLQIGIVLLSVSCNTGSVSRNPSFTLPETFRLSGEKKAPDRWWTAFDDSKLNRLVRSSFSGNFQLKTAWDRLARARAIAKREGADLYPGVEGSLSYSRDVTKNTGGGGTIVGGSFVGGGSGGRTYSNEYTLSLNASYEVDVWGRVRAANEAAEQEVRASRENVRATALAISAQITDIWYRLVENRAQLNLLDEQIETNQQYLELVRTRFQQGTAGSTEVLQQENLLKSVRTSRHQVRARINTLKHQLAVLQGNAPGTEPIPERNDLPKLPDRPETGVPVRWLHKRPDLRRAFHRIQSSDRRVAEAIADQFPRITITPRFRTDAATPANLLETWSARLMLNLIQPLIDGGRRRAEVERTRAAKKEQVHQYALAVLNGIREVEDALTNEVQQQNVIQGLRDQLDRSRKTVDQLLDSYQNGAVGYLRVLDEIRNRQQLQRNLLSARGQLFRFRIDLYEALGGSWDLPLPENVPETLSSGLTKNR